MKERSDGTVIGKAEGKTVEVINVTDNAPTAHARGDHGEVIIVFTDGSELRLRWSGAKTAPGTQRRYFDADDLRDVMSVTGRILKRVEVSPAVHYSSVNETGWHTSNTRLVTITMDIGELNIHAVETAGGDGHRLDMGIVYVSEVVVTYVDPNENLFRELVTSDPERLIRMLGSNMEPRLLTFAAEIAGRIEVNVSNEAHEVLDALLKLLDHDDAVVREGALYGLCTLMERLIPRASRTRIRTVVERVRYHDPSDTIRAIAAECWNDWNEQGGRVERMVFTAPTTDITIPANTTDVRACGGPDSESGSFVTLALQAGENYRFICGGDGPELASSIYGPLPDGEVVVLWRGCNAIVLEWTK